MDNIARIKQVSGKYRLFFSALVICIPIFDALFWTFFNYLPDAGNLILRVELTRQLDVLSRFLLFVASLIPISMACYGVFVLSRLFGLYENGVVFSAANVKLYRRLGYVIVGWVLAKFIYIPLSSVIISLNNPPGERFVAVGFELLDIITLIMGAIAILISWVMDEGRKLEDEREYIV